jgi:hypothetical protein
MDERTVGRIDGMDGWTGWAGDDAGSRFSTRSERELKSGTQRC